MESWQMGLLLCGRHGALRALQDCDCSEDAIAVASILWIPGEDIRRQVVSGVTPVGH